MYQILKDAWRDPVWSKVIATLIIGFFGFILLKLYPNWESQLAVLAGHSLTIPLWIIFLASVAVFLSIGLVDRNRQVISEGMSSEQWFSEIEQQIKDCSYARIYLREFSHPDKFRPEHREPLLSFMNSLAQRLEAGADIRVIAYHEKPSEKSGMDWLRAEVQKDKMVLEKVKLINTQPTSNSSSMYLFDNGTVIYNRREKSSYSYHVENQNGSIVHLLIKNGFAVTERELA